MRDRSQRMLLGLALSASSWFGCGEEGAVGPDASAPAAREDAALGVDASAVTTQDAASASPRADARVVPVEASAAADATRGQDASSAEPRDANVAPLADASGSASDASLVDASASAPSLPPIQDPASPGPFGVNVVASATGLSTHTLYIPAQLGKDGTKHPMIVWTNGNGGTASFYDAFLRHFASHGFFMVVDKASTSMREMEYQHQRDGIEWALKEAARSDGPYAGKLDASRLAIMGHSMGSLSSFVNAGDKRLKTTVHWSGGLVGNPTGTDESAIQKMHAPAAFLCGGADTTAGPSCANDFRDAPKGLPVFYATLAGVGHLGVFGDRNGGEYGRVGVAWMRWKLADDPSFRDYFVGSACKARARPWTAMSRNLE